MFNQRDQHDRLILEEAEFFTAIRTNDIKHIDDIIFHRKFSIHRIGTYLESGAQYCIPLHEATQCENEAMVRELLKRGAKVAQTNPRCANRTALHYAAHWNNCDAIRLLLEYKADVNGGNMCDASPLNVALKAGNKEAVQLLLKRGANLTIVGTNGKSALDYVSENSDLDILKLLIRAGLATIVPGNGYARLMARLEEKALWMGGQALAKVEAWQNTNKFWLIERVRTSSTTLGKGFSLWLEEALGFLDRQMMGEQSGSESFISSLESPCVLCRKFLRQSPKEHTTPFAHRKSWEVAALSLQLEYCRLCQVISKVMSEGGNTTGEMDHYLLFNNAGIEVWSRIERGFPLRKSATVQVARYNGMSSCL
jgi:hypothetical protein